MVQLRSTTAETRQRGRLSQFRVLPLVAAALLAGCSSVAKVDPAPTGSIATPVTGADFEAAVDYWAARYTNDESDRTTALGYAKALQRTGRTDQAVAVLQKTAIHLPDDREVLASDLIEMSEA